MTLLVVASSAISTIAGWLPGEWTVTASAIAGGLYTISRGLSKQGTTNDDVRDTLQAALAKGIAVKAAADRAAADRAYPAHPAAGSSMPPHHTAGGGHGPAAGFN